MSSLAPTWTTDKGYLYAADGKRIVSFPAVAWLTPKDDVHVVSVDEYRRLHRVAVYMEAVSDE